MWIENISTEYCSPVSGSVLVIKRNMMVRARLYWASASMLRQCCDDASDTGLIENNGVFPKWNRNSLNSANSGNLINHWSMNWAQFKDHVSCWHWVSILVSYSRGGRFEPLYCNDKYFCQLLQNGLQPHFEVIPLFSMRTGLLASWRGCHSIDAEAWCK